MALRMAASSAVAACCRVGLSLLEQTCRPSAQRAGGFRRHTPGARRHSASAVLVIRRPPKCYRPEALVQVLCLQQPQKLLLRFPEAAGVGCAHSISTCQLWSVSCCMSRPHQLPPSTNHQHVMAFRLRPLPSEGSLMLPAGSPSSTDDRGLGIDCTGGRSGAATVAAARVLRAFCWRPLTGPSRMQSCNGLQTRCRTCSEPTKA